MIVTAEQIGFGIVAAALLACKHNEVQAAQLALEMPQGKGDPAARHLAVEGLKKAFPNADAQMLMRCCGGDPFAKKITFVPFWPNWDSFVHKVKRAAKKQSLVHVGFVTGGQG